jgi:hypothetical protein
MNIVWVSGCIVHALLTSAIEKAEWSVSSPERLIPWKKSSQYAMNVRLTGPLSQPGRGDYATVCSNTHVPL